MPTTQTLFDDFVRTDPMPAGAVESSFHFLNRVDQPFWNRVREVLEDWFSEFPVEHRADLRARFRKADANQHWPAWWELYLHNLFGRLGFDVTVHPALPKGGNHPDFLLSLDGEATCYVEAVCVNTGAIIARNRHWARESRLIDIINEVPHGGFHVSLSINATGPADLRRKFVKGRVEDWMSTLKEGDERSVLSINRDGWEIRLSALKAGERSGRRPLISMGPVISGGIDDIGVLRASAERKRGHYPVGNLPLVLAILQKNDPSDEDCIDRLLYGDRVHGGDRINNGLWGPDPDAATGWPDALIVGTSIHPWTIAKRLPALIVAPGREEGTAEINLPPSLEVADDPELAADLLGLPVEWPGPEKSFEGI